MSAPTTHVRKRQYQPSLTSYFNRDVNRSTSSQSSSPLSPPLPADTQSSLLTVGMRVRKAVPEGYKTHKTLDVSSPFPSSAPPASATWAPPTFRTKRSGELLPFCGLHKIGGLSAQDIPPSSAPLVMQRGVDVDEDGLPLLSGSQNTIGSSQGSFMSGITPVNQRKRAYEDEAEAAMDDFFSEMDATEGDTEPTDLAATRRIAPLKTSTIRKGATQGEVRVVSEDDFDEAEFLAPMEVDS